MLRHDNFAMGYSANFPLTITFLRERGASYEEAQELAQGAWTRAWEYRDQLRRDDLLWPWVRTIALNMMRDAIRGRKQPELLAFDEKQWIAHAIPTRAIELNEIWTKCSPAHRGVLEGLLLGRTAEEEARRTNKSLSAVQKARQRTLAAILARVRCGGSDRDNRFQGEADVR